MGHSRVLNGGLVTDPNAYIGLNAGSHGAAISLRLRFPVDQHRQPLRRLFRHRHPDHHQRRLRLRCIGPYRLQRRLERHRDCLRQRFELDQSHRPRHRRIPAPAPSSRTAAWSASPAPRPSAAPARLEFRRHLHLQHRLPRDQRRHPGHPWRRNLRPLRHPGSRRSENQHRRLQLHLLRQLQRRRRHHQSRLRHRHPHRRQHLHRRNHRQRRHAGADHRRRPDRLPGQYRHHRRLRTPPSPRRSAPRHSAKW